MASVTPNDTLQPWSVSTNPEATCQDGDISDRISRLEVIDGQVEFYTCESFNGLLRERSELCGDGRIQPGEQCDDGNRIDGDGCSSSCTICTDASAGCEQYAEAGDLDGDGKSNLIDDDDDGDGIPTAEEQEDLNGDQIMDGLQGNVMTEANPAIEVAPTFSFEGTGDARCSIITGYRLETKAEAGLDDIYTYPFGLITFELPGCYEADIKVYYHGVSDLSEYTFRKFGPTTPGDETTWEIYDFPAEKGTDLIDGEEVPYHAFRLRDGELGDDTGPDGIIVDGGGLGGSGTFYCTSGSSLSNTTCTSNADCSTCDPDGRTSAYCAGYCPGSTTLCEIGSSCGLQVCA